MNFYAASALVNLVVGVFLCLAVLTKDKRTKLDLYFAFFAFSAIVWSAGYFFWQLAGAYDPALFWSRFLIAGAIGIGLFYLHFVLEFLNLSRAKKTFLLIADAIFIILFLLNLTPLVVNRVESRLSFPFWPVPGIAFHIFLIAWLGYIFYSTLLLFRAYQTAEGIFRQQIKYLFFGVSIGFIAGSFNYFLWYNIPIPPVTNILVSLYFILVFYAIIRFRFFNIKIIATEVFVLILFAATVAQFFIPSFSTNIFWAFGFIMLILIAGGFLIKGVLNEVRQREQLQVLTTKLEQANKQLKKLDQARADFITMASHQLRTPPSTLKWYLAAILA
ncbi:MAG: histidine kinase N-terminal 7TM domain-containing protein, partial [Candidatus Uhrbacteria bacterium]|nr:histidine kinase N-terminal 7TM domain-containing protein [Candidatus Uhrbacteria bacterium]